MGALSNAATSNAERVRVEVFSKIRAISLPSSRFTSVPAYLAIFSASDSWSRNRSSLGIEIDLLQEAAVAEVVQGQPPHPRCPNAKPGLSGG